MRRVPRSDKLVAIFLLGLLLFSPVFLRLFRIDGFLFGVPVLYLYLFLAWTLLILLIALASGAFRPRSRRRGPGGRRTA